MAKNKKAKKEKVEEPLADEIIYAGFKRRVKAATIDLLIFLVLAFLLLGYETLFNKNLTTIESNIAKIEGDLRNNLISEKEATSLTKEHYQDVISTFIRNSFLQIALGFIFIYTFWVYKFSTPGKMIFHMKIVNADTLEPPTKLNLLLRFIGYFISFIVLFLGFISIVFDKKKQGWHDKIANTIVIHTKNLDSKEELDKKFKRDTYMVVIVLITFFTYKYFFTE